MKTKLIVLLFASVIACVIAAQQQSGPSVRSPGSDAQIISKLSEIVRIRERLARSYELLLAAGRASEDGMFEIELAEARVDLARERGQREDIVTQLKALVTAHERRLKRMTDSAKDRVASADIDRAQVALLEAQVRLLRVEK